MATQGLNIPVVSQALNGAQAVADNVVPNRDPVFHGLVAVIIGWVSHLVMLWICHKCKITPDALNAWIAANLSPDVTATGCVSAIFAGLYFGLQALHQNKQDATVAAAASVKQAVANTTVVGGTNAS